jgi:hypothetical protein
MFVLAWLGAGCLETPGASSDGGDAGGVPDAGEGPGTTEWRIPLGVSLPYIAIADGDLAVAASFEGTIELDPPVTAEAGLTDLLVASFAADSTQRFAEVYGGSGGEFPTAVTVSRVSGEIGVFGIYGAGEGDVGGAPLPEPNGPYNVFVARYGPVGEHLWSFPGAATSGAASTYVLSMNGSGALGLSGYYSSEMALGPATLTYTGPGRDLYFARISRAGEVSALTGFGGSGDQVGAGALFDGLGSLYLFGTQTGPFVIDEFSPDADGDGGLFVSQIDDTGTDATWLFDSVGGAVGSLRGAVTPDGSLILTGWFEGTFAFDLPDQNVLTSRGGSDVFVALIRPDGTVAWVEQFGGVGDDEPRGVAVGPDGEVAVAGSFRADASLGSGGALVTSNGGTDIFVLAFGADQSLRWAHSFGDVEDDTGLSVAVDTGGDVVLSALYRGEVDFGAGEPLMTGADSESVLIRFR